MMTKRAYTMFTIFAITVLVGTLMISAEATGKPIKEVKTVSGIFPGQSHCNTSSTGHIDLVIETMFDSDGIPQKKTVTASGEFIDDADVVIGLLKSKTLNIGTNADDEVTISKSNILIKCLNGEKNEHAYEGFTIDANGKLHQHSSGK